MKTTLMFRRMTANPRRTTLAHLKDASELTAAPAGAQGEAQDGTRNEEQGAAPTAPRPLPQRTANPRRTVLTELPKAPIIP